MPARIAEPLPFAARQLQSVQRCGRHAVVANGLVLVSVVMLLSLVANGVVLVSVVMLLSADPPRPMPPKLQRSS